MSIGGKPVSCDLECELTLGIHTQRAFLRTCSLSRCFVQTELEAKQGDCARVRIEREGQTRCTVQGLVTRGAHQRIFGDESVQGLELHLSELDPVFFTIYSELCQAQPTEEERTVSLPLVSVPKRGGKRDRRTANRSPIEIPVRAFDEERRFVGTTQDISESGTFILGEGAPEPGDRLHLEFLCEPSFFAEGLVVRTDAPESKQEGFAVRFVPMVDLITMARNAKPRAPDGLGLSITSAQELGWIYLNQISKGGMVIPGEHTEEQGAIVQVTIDYRGGPEPATYVVRGRVICRFDSPPGLGLQILNRAGATAWFQERLQSGDS